MGLLEKIRRNAALVTGDFERIFGDFKLPPCPDVVLSLTEAVNNPDVFLDDISAILETDPALTSLILKTVNSALYGFPGAVSSVFKAVSMLGFKEIENIALGYAMRQVVRDPGLPGFDFSIFWTDSLYRALFARHAAMALGTEAEDAFAAALLQDMALPVLLTQWFDVYKPVYDIWSMTGMPIHQVEKKQLSWNHCEAAAWIAGKWGLPDLIICCTGLHSASYTEIYDLGLSGTAVTAVALSSLVTPAFRDDTQAGNLICSAGRAGIDREMLFQLTGKVEEQLGHLAVSLDIKTVERPAFQQIVSKYSSKKN